MAVRVDGSVYRIVEESDPGTNATGYRYDIQTDESGRTAATPEEPVALTDLPLADRTTLRLALPDPTRDLTEASFDVVFANTDAATGEASAFVPQPTHEYVQYGETTFQFRPAGTTTVTVRPYRVRLVEEAESAAAFGENLLAADGTSVSSEDISADGQNFIETAITEGSAQACSPLPAHVEEALNALDIELGNGGDHHVNDDGNWYEVDAHRFDR